ncbi:MAG: sulfurtransferase [Gammaproteobacteria bacterium]|nr:sulfurtransferase [Gammaproteobacteria bacterium]
MPSDREYTVGENSPLISVEELLQEIGRGGLRIVDCRFDLMQPLAGRRDYEEAHIPGAVYADLDMDLSAATEPGSGRHPLPDPEELARTFGRLGIGSTTRVVLYDDRSGAVAARGWWLLRWLGHARAALLNGGFARWRALRGPVESGPVKVTAQNFVARPDCELVLETGEVVAAGENCRELRLIDARDSARFRGEAEPIDTVAGHIPGALSLPFSKSLDNDGCWRKRAELRRVWQTVLGRDLEAPCSVMCGSGVTACHLVISALLAGLTEPRVYVGSWSEWITDPDRPIATGDS